MVGVIAVDAGALIALVDGSDSHHRWAVDFFIQSTGAELAVSALTMAEIMVHPAKKGTADQFAKRLAGLQMKVIPVDGEDSSALARLRAESRLRMPDAVVLHTALTLSQALATTDMDLAHQAEVRGLQVYHPVRDGSGVSA